MTFWYPDISNYQAGLTIQPNTVVVCAKGSEGTTYTDPTYLNFRKQTLAEGGFFFGYHYVWLNDPIAEAQFAFGIHGPQTALMLDIENPNRVPTIPEILAFVTEYRRLGGTVKLAYLPRWYWQSDMGSPDLTPLANALLRLVSSNYTVYSDTGPGWNAYGGMTPYIWQYTDALPYGGQNVDFNACKDDLANFKKWMIGDVVVNPLPAGNYQPTINVPLPGSMSGNFEQNGNDVLFEIDVLQSGVFPNWGAIPNLSFTLPVVDAPNSYASAEAYCSWGNRAYQAAVYGGRVWVNVVNQTASAPPAGSVWRISGRYRCA